MLSRRTFLRTAAASAAAPLVSLAAWQALVDRAHTQRGQKVLAHAGSGGCAKVLEHA